MKRLLGIMIFVFSCLSFVTAPAGEMRIRPGETVRLGDVTVMCEDRSSGSTPVALSECQYWDKYDKRCLYEKKTLSADGFECVEDCQHWDSYEKTCEYATKCLHYPDQHLFVRTLCELFDPYDHTCKKAKELRIGGKSGRR